VARCTVQKNVSEMDYSDYSAELSCSSRRGDNETHSWDIIRRRASHKSFVTANNWRNSARGGAREWIFRIFRYNITFWYPRGKYPAGRSKCTPARSSSTFLLSRGRGKISHCFERQYCRRRVFRHCPRPDKPLLDVDENREVEGRAKWLKNRERTSEGLLHARRDRRANAACVRALIMSPKGAWSRRKMPFAHMCGYILLRVAFRNRAGIYGRLRRLSHRSAIITGRLLIARNA